MKPSSRRRIERELDAIVRRGEGACSLCRKPFPDNSRTFGGVTKIGSAALAGECCENKIAILLGKGVFLAKQDFGDIPTGTGEGTGASLDKIDEAIDAIQSVAKSRRAQREDISARAGVSAETARMVLDDTDWKQDDAAWFEAHPDRSHRIRPVFPSEYSPAELGDVPPGHLATSLVRQVEPGKRIRFPFARNLLAAVPDEEATLHSLFDALSQERGGASVSSAEIASRTAAHRAAKSRKPS